jgi:hypothetical protein
MTEPLDEALGSVEAGIRARRAIGEADVRALRRAVYARPQVDRAAASAVLRLHGLAETRDAAWNDFYLDVLMDFLFWGRDDGVIGESDAAWLVEAIRADGRTERQTELELLLRLVFRARQCPEALRRLAREATRASVLGSSKARVGGGGRSSGAIDQQDVEAIRRLVYGLGGGEGPVISAEEAEWLIELDHATAAADNAPEWRELFVKALMMHMLHGGGSPDAIDAGEAEWLCSRLDRGQGPTSNGTALLAELAEEASYLDARIATLVPREGPVPGGSTFGRKPVAEPV